MIPEEGGPVSGSIQIEEGQVGVGFDGMSHINTLGDDPVQTLSGLEWVQAGQTCRKAGTDAQRMPASAPARGLHTVQFPEGMDEQGAQQSGIRKWYIHRLDQHRTGRGALQRLKGDKQTAEGT